MRPTSTSSWPLRLAMRAFLHRGRRERGTILLMVVGVLALLAIIAVVYATLGRADRISSVTVARNQRSVDQTADIAEYLSSVIGSSVFARYPEPTGNGPVFHTRGYTYPVTDKFYLSVRPDVQLVNRSGVASNTITAGIDRFSLFSADGDNTNAWPGWTGPSGTLTFRDPREFGDPFLASFRPTFLGFNDGSGSATPNPVPMNAIRFASQRDWLNISNFAPSGNFINLANLRNNFDAKHGFVPDPSDPNKNYLSYGLTLFDPVTGLSFNRDANPASSNQRLAYRPGELNTNIRAPHPLISADWSTNQVFAYRPAVPDDRTTSGNQLLPADHEYLLNQWCDADGDGFIDSRWFSLDRIDDFNQATNEAIVRSVIPANSRLRWFVAARAVDSSAMLNVNAHSDFFSGPLSIASSGSALQDLIPRDSSVPGLTPADIDLARLLTMNDAFGDFEADRRNSSVNVGAIGPFPSNINVPSDDYRQYLFNIDPQNSRADEIGRAAWASLFDFRARGSSRSSAVNNGGFDRVDQLNATANPFVTDARIRREFFENSVLARSESTRYRNSLATSTGFRTSGFFSLDDEIELRRFWGVNDPETRSQLEAVLGGRHLANNSDRFSPLRDSRSFEIEFKGRDFEAATRTPALHDIFPRSDNSPQDPTVDGARTLFAAHADVRQYLTTLSGARPLRDSGVAPGYSSFLTNPTDPNSIKFNQVRSASIRSDLTLALRNIQEYAANPTVAANKANFDAAVRFIFSLYANALVPYTDRGSADPNEPVRAVFPDAWISTQAVWNDTPTDLARRFQINGLAYGGSPELATMMAAWMTANLIDMYDRDDQNFGGGANRVPTRLDQNIPTALTLEMVQNLPQDASPRGSLGNTSIPTSTTVPYTSAYSGTAVGLLPASRRPDSVDTVGRTVRQAGNEQALSGRKTIYGIEPAPFLTEYGFLYLITDAPDSAGGDNDETPAGADPGGGGGPINRQPSEPQPITIKLDPDMNNADFLGEIIAFQLHNPWPTDIVLYDPNAPTQDRIKFYFEFANRFYAPVPQQVDQLLPEVGGTVELLRAGETRTFYSINPGTIEQMWQRVKNSLERAPQPFRPNPAADRTTFVAWLTAQFGSNSMNMLPVYPDSLDPIRPRSTLPTARFGQQFEMDIWGEATISGGAQSGTGFSGYDAQSLNQAANAELKVAHLWRVVRAQTGDLNTSDNGAQRNLTYNDILVDRLRDPTTDAEGSLFPHRPRGDASSPNGTKVRGTIGGDESATSATRILDNSGFSGVIWASVRRSSDRASPDGTKEADGKPTRGVLPPWCLEVKSDLDDAWKGGRSLFSLNDKSESVKDAGRNSDYPRSSERFKSLRDLILETNAANPNIKRAMVAKTANPIVQTPALTGMIARKYREVAVEYAMLGQETGGTQLTDPKGVQNPMLFSRAGDFLLPLAIGPMYDPSLDYTTALSLNTSSDMDEWIPSGNAKIAKREAQWLTLSEALALASGYYNPTRWDDPLRNFSRYDVSKPVPDLPKTHRGHLRLDAFTPYFYDTAVGAPQPTAGGNVPDQWLQPLGPGVPFSLTVIDQFRAAAGIGSSMQRVSINTALENWPVDQSLRAAPGDATTSVPLVNVNTAPSFVLRTLPMLAPDNDPDSWMRRAFPRTGLTGPARSLFDYVTNPTNAAANPALNWDIASTLEAYRDRSVVRKRGVPAAAAVTPEDITQFRDFSRASITLTNGIREQRGFKSIGEVLNANIRDRNGPNQAGQEWDQFSSMFIASTDPDPTVAFNPTAPELAKSRLFAFPEVHSANHFQFNSADGRFDTTARDTIASVDPTKPDYHNPSIQYHRRLAGEVMNGYQDKLAVINALSNTISVRSDIFTVYFVIHGYAPEDVQNLEDDQPMIPSVAKRFVMVVDRSNVQNIGDKPRIVMIKEVPIR